MVSDWTIGGVNFLHGDGCTRSMGFAFATKDSSTQKYHPMQCIVRHNLLLIVSTKNQDHDLLEEAQR